MKLGPTLPWFYCRSSDKTIRSFHASLLHLENENITSHFSPLEARVKMNLTETAKAMLLRQAGQKDKTRLKKSWRTGMSQKWGSGWWFEQTDTTNQWQVLGVGFCWLRLLWMEPTPLPWLGSCCSPLRTPRVSPQCQIFQIFLTAESAGVAPTAHWTMPRVCCLNSFLTPEGTEAFLSLAQQLPLGSQCLPTDQPSRLQLFHMLRIWNFCGNHQISKC